MLKDTDKADKLKQSLPPSRFFYFKCLLKNLFRILDSIQRTGLKCDSRKIRQELFGEIHMLIYGRMSDLTSTINDVPKKNKKGKRVA